MGDRQGGLGWLAGLVIGAVLAVVCMLRLGRQNAPAAPGYAVEREGSEQQSVGVEFVLRFRILLPEGRAKDDR